MADYKFVTYETLDSGKVARIMLNRPEARNAQNRGLLVDLNDAFLEAEADDEVRVVILGGMGPMFSSGHDMGSKVSMEEGMPGPNQHYTRKINGATRKGAESLMLQEWHYYFQNTLRWRNLRKITIGQAHGDVYAAGLMLLWACDLIVCAEGTRFADVVGTRLGMCGTEYFAHPWELGPRKAKELLLTGDSIDAEEAHGLGMVSKIFPADDLTRADAGVRRADRDPALRHVAARQGSREPERGQHGLLQRARTPASRCTSSTTRTGPRSTRTSTPWPRKTAGCRTGRTLRRSSRPSRTRFAPTPDRACGAGPLVRWRAAPRRLSGGRDVTAGEASSTLAAARGGEPVTRRAPFSDNPRVGARGQRTRQRILDAALQLFGDEGFHQCSIARISEKANCSRVSFYQYFSGKEDVFSSLAGQVSRQISASTEAIDPLTPDAAGWEGLRAWVGRYGDIHARYGPIFRALPGGSRRGRRAARGSGAPARSERGPHPLEALDQRSATAPARPVARVADLLPGPDARRRRITAVRRPGGLLEGAGGGGHHRRHAPVALRAECRQRAGQHLPSAAARGVRSGRPRHVGEGGGGPGRDGPTAPP